MNYSTIKWLLKSHIKNNVNSHWIWKEDQKEFRCMYNRFNPDDDRIYTAKQLLDTLENLKDEEEKDKNTTQETT